ncbi:M14 family zinc carboxypeptidase, partial [Paraburkholderia kirstenboschensis]
MQPLSFLPDSFAEYEDLRAILDQGSASFAIRTLCETTVRGRRFGVHTASIGSTDPQAPAIGFFGGIHGLERIGSQLVLDYMRALLARLEWDELLVRQLQSIRLIFVPIVNPGGMWAATRANPNGVDLMRNAPQNADERVPLLAG